MLTDTQADILKFIKSQLASRAVAPSYREIQEHFGYRSIGTVQDHLRALKKKGYLEESSASAKLGSARQLIPKGYSPQSAKRLEIYGEIAAGSLRESEQIVLGSLWVTEELVKRESFALRVTGDSMTDVGILEGDFLIVEKTERVKINDIVVALVNGETTVKRLIEKNGKRWLKPENTTMALIEIEGKEVSFQGRVVGLQRKLIL